MPSDVMKKVNDELLSRLKNEADDLEEGMKNGEFADMQSCVKALCKMSSAQAHVLVEIAGAGVVTVDECAMHRKHVGGRWKAAAVYCGTGLGALVALLKFLKG